MKSFIEYILFDETIFSKYIILHIGTASSTVGLMTINSQSKILDEEKNVCTVLDGDMKEKTEYKNKPYIFFSPFLDIEDVVLEKFRKDEFGRFTEEDLKDPKKYNVQRAPKHKDYSKSIYKMLLKYNITTEHRIFENIISSNKLEVSEFKNNLLAFLNA